MRVELVVARYNEDLAWLEDVPKHIEITIYNKGKNDIVYPHLSLPNVGRESHTYLYHIIKNYDNLADKTIFCQGDTIFHSTGFIELLKNTDKFEPVQPLSAHYWPEGEPPYYFSNPPLPVLAETRNLWISGQPIHVEYMDNEFTTRYPHLYFEHYFIKLNEFVKEQYGINNVFKFWAERFRLKDVDLEEMFPVCYAGIFSVDKSAILNNSVDFYNNIINTILYDIRLKNDGKPFDCGLYLEKLWLVIFNYKKYNKNYIQLKVHDYPYYNKQLTVNYITKNKSAVSFSIYSIVSQLYLEFILGKKTYRLALTQSGILLKTGKQTIYKSTAEKREELIRALPFNSTIIIKIVLDGNRLFVKSFCGENAQKSYILIDVKIPNIENNAYIKEAVLFTLTDENKVKDLFEKNKLTKKNIRTINRTHTIKI